MIGQGRPAFLRLALACAALSLCACPASRATAQNAPSAEPMHLRITWGGEPTHWIGRVALDEGTLSELKLLESGPDGIGSIWLEEGQLRVRSLSAHKIDSIEVAVQAA